MNKECNYNNQLITFLPMITTKDQAIQFLTTMQYLYPLYHPEDDPKNIENASGNRVFNDEQCKYLEDRFDEVYNVLHDPCGIIVHEIRPTMTMFNLIKDTPCN